MSVSIKQHRDMSQNTDMALNEESEDLSDSLIGTSVRTTVVDEKQFKDRFNQLAGFYCSTEENK